MADSPLRLAPASFADRVVRDLLAEWDAELGFAPKGGSVVETADFAPPRGAFVVARSAGVPVGCGGLRHLADGTGEIKRLYVRRGARGRGVGRALLDALEQRAAGAGYDELRLDTAGDDAPSLALFRSAGFSEIEDYNGNPHARHWFAKRIRAR